MIKSLYRLLAIAPLSLSTIAMAATPPAKPEFSMDYVAKWRDAINDSNDVAWNLVEGLTTEIGARPAGTASEAKARDWAVAHLSAMGFANVHVENYQMQTWVRGVETAETVSPFPQKMAVTALGNSGSTGDAGITAEIVYFPTLDALKAVPDGSLKGKIAFVSHAMHATQDGSSYGAYGPARFGGPNIAAKKGAAAIVIRSMGTDHHRNPHAGNTNFDKDVTPIPAGALSVPDAENLERMLSRGKPVSLHLTLTPRNLGLQTSGNVIAEVPGSNPKLAPIIIACHLDSWDLATGAIDNGAGCAIITAAAAAKAVALGTSASVNKRTIRVLWAGAEEVGGFGGKAYAEAHKGEPHGLAMESDFGADRVWRVDLSLPASAKPLADKISAALAPLGISTGKEAAHGGTDVEPIIAAQNLAVIDLQQDGTRYFDIHHTPDDTLDKIDKAQLRQNVAAWTAVLMILANDESDLTMPAIVEKKP